MDIEAIVKKYGTGLAEFSAEELLRAALTELAAEHDRKQALLLEAHCERVNSLQERIWQLESERVPEGMTPVPTEILDRFPELNMCNYGHDDVSELNAWGVELVLAAAPAKEGE